MYRNSMITIHGYIGTTVEGHKWTKSNKPWVKFSVGVTNQKSDGVPQAQWYQVMVFGERAIGLLKDKRLQKGYEAVVHGLHVTQPFRDKNGYTKYSNTIFSDFESINKPPMFTKKAMEDLDKVNQIDQEISDEDIADMEAPF